jgi:O-antigen/teichoic acid export membrane protein
VPFSGISGVGLAILAGVLLSAVAGSLSPFPFFDIDRRQSYSAGIVTLIDVLSLLATSAAYSLDAISLPLLTCFLGAKQILITACQHAYYRMFVRKLAWAPSGPVLKRLIRLSWPIMVSSFLVQVPIQGGLLQVKWFQGADEAGTFAVAAQAMSACIMLGSIVVRVLHPHIAGPMGWHPAFLKKLVAFLILAVGGMGLIVYSIFFYLIFYQMPAEYAFAGELLGPLVLGALFIIAHSFADLYLLTRMRAGIMLIIHAVKAAAFVAITSLAAVSFGSYGVAVGGLWACGIGLFGVGVVLMRIKRVH